MTLTYLNAELDPKKEYELPNINDFGFRVEIKYNEQSWLFPQKPVQVIKNVTEIHNHFDNFGKPTEDIAFESDIHAQGFTRKIKDIESVVITLETENCFRFEDEKV